MKNFHVSGKLLALLGSIGILHVAGLSVFSSSANADPFNNKIKSSPSIVNNTKIVGNLIPLNAEGGGLSYPVFQTNCSNITVSLIGNNRKVLASTQASGTYISNGCTYSLTVGGTNYVILGNNPSFEIVARGSLIDKYSYIISGRQSISKPFPSQFDLKVYNLFVGPR
jgi:hypothetical protein